jgi:hypothetical protein
MVTDKQFAATVKRRIDACMRILSTKNEEYATKSSRLHNFEVAAKITGWTVPEAVLGMMNKHLVSVVDMALDRREFSRAQLDEKFTDIHNYLYLLEEAIVDHKEAEAKRQIARDMLESAKEHIKHSKPKEDEMKMHLSKEQ